MSHEIDFSNERANVAYVGEAPWHGLGHRLEPDQSTEVWAREAGFMWKAQKSPVEFLVEGEGTFFRRYPEKQVVYRDDTNMPLGVVGSTYNIVQPMEVLEFFREYTEAGDLQMETAGCLAGGRRLWALAKMGEDIELMGDKISPYLLLATSMDGSMATRAQFTSVRVVCQNTLSLSVNRQSESSVRVTHSQKFDPDVVKRDLGIGRAAWARFTVAATALAQRKVTDEEASVWVNRVVGTIMKDGVEESARPRTAAQVLEAIRTSPGADMESSRDTAWGLVNGLTYWVDHVQGRSSDSRLNSAWFGDGAALKTKALSAALQLA